MALSAPQYRVISLPDGIPECLKGQSPSGSGGSTAKADEKPSSGGSSFSFGKPKKDKNSKGGGGFDPSRALKGAGKSKQEEETEASACRTRGDGLFDGGSAFRREGNKVIMAPSAFSEDNAMKTMEEMEKNHLLGGRNKQPPPPPQPSQEPAPAAPSKEHAALQAEMAESIDNMKNLDPAEVQGIFDLIRNGLDSEAASQSSSTAARGRSGNDGAMFDLGDDGPRSRSSRTSQPPQQKEDNDQDGSSFGFSHLAAEAPVYKIEEKAPTAKHPFKHIQVDMELPKLETVADADVRVGSVELVLKAPPHYRFKSKLPCMVVDGESNAKWSKAKKRLTLYLRAK